jgi:hypothetical protein
MLYEEHCRNKLPSGTHTGTRSQQNFPGNSSSGNRRQGHHTIKR